MTNKRETYGATVSDQGLAFTGERFVPELKGQLAYEHLHRYALAAEYVKERVALDVASGEGYGSALLARYARSVVGVDVSEEAVTHARRRYGSLAHVSFLQGRCEELPFAGSTFDTVVSFETIEHIAEQRRFLQEVRRVLKPGGMLILSSPNRAAYRKESEHNPFHVHELDRTELESLLREVFPSVRLLGQRLTFSSHIWPLESVGPAGFCHYTDGEHTYAAQPPFEAEYFLALCAAGGSVELPAVSLFTSCADDLLREYHDRGRWGQSLEAELQEKEQLLRALRQEITLLRRQASCTGADHTAPDDRASPDSLLEAGESLEEAVERLTRYLQEHPEDPRAYNDLGVLYHMMDALETAVAYFRRAVALDRQFLVARKNLADALIQRGSLEEATRLYQGIVGEHPDDAAALAALGSLLLQAERPSARYYLERAVELDPANMKARTLLDQFSEKEILPRETGAENTRRCVQTDYEGKLQSEILRYAADVQVHDLPGIHHVVNALSLSLWLEQLTGKSTINDWWASEIDAVLAHTPERMVRVLSIGCGNGDIELDVLARVSDPQRVRLLGLDVNPAMIERANNLAVQRGFPYATFAVQDLNHITLSETFDVVLASHSLHHIIELEKLFAAIDAATSDEMVFLVNDMIGRNGHVMWPATYTVVRAVWDTLDRKYKYNAYWKCYDHEPMNHDCSSEGFEGVRAQDILPLIIRQFDCEMFLPFSTIVNRFTDRGYGHNFRPEEPRDVDLIRRILELDIHLLKERKLAPVQCVMKLRKKGTVQELRYMFQTPEEAIHLRTREIDRDEFSWDPPNSPEPALSPLVTS